MFSLTWVAAIVLSGASGSSHLKVSILEASVTRGPGMAKADDTEKFQAKLEARVELRGKPLSVELQFHLVKGTQRHELESGPTEVKMTSGTYRQTFELAWPASLTTENGWTVEVEVLQAKRVVARASRALVIHYLP